MKKERGKTLLRWLILLSLFGLSLAAISIYGGTVSYSFFFAVLLVPVVCLIYLLIVYIRFRIYQEIGSRTVVSGQPVSYFFTLQNEDHFAFSSVRVNFYSSFSRIEKLPENPEYELLPGDRYTYETRIICRYRGEYDVGVKEVILTDFFRLFHFRYRYPGAVRATVLPKIIEVEEIASIRRLLAQMQLEAKNEATEPDAVLRDYVPGDPEKLISWRMSARAGKLKVRNMIREERNGISIFFETFREEDEKPESYLPAENKLLEIVIALALYAVKRQIPVSILDSIHTKPDELRSMQAFRDFYDRTSSLMFGRAAQTTRIFSDPMFMQNFAQSKLVFLALRSFPAELLPFLEKLVRSGIYVVVYLVTEEDAPETALTTFGERMKVNPVRPDDDLAEVL
ncbi:MAG: DUF58 domain-containing protein [Lachnospiraceae bacterium]|nr:DUF58 domain-containing protein [Lachnospiraceae bacterium]